VSVACGDLKFKNVHGVDALIDPILIVEVLSATTAARDHEAKFAAYQAIGTFGEYLLISQDEPRVVRYARQTHGSWERRDITNIDHTVTLTSVACELSMRDIYDGVTFSR
jgi:Uma2 family endonuclease